MIVVNIVVECPECNTKFRVPANLLGLEGRVVRCGRCSHQWHRAATKEELLGTKEEIEVEEIEIEAVDNLPDEEEIIADSSWFFSFMDSKFIAVSFAVFLLLTVIFAMLFPVKVIQHFPQVYPVYKVLRLVSSPIVVHLVDAMYRKDHYGQDILYIELELENITAKKALISPLQVGLYGEDGIILKEWPLPSRGNSIPGHETLSIKFGLRDVPTGGKTIIIRRNLEQIYGIHYEDDEVLEPASEPEPEPELEPELNKEKKHGGQKSE